MLVDLYSYYTYTPIEHRHHNPIANKCCYNHSMATAAAAGEAETGEVEDMEVQIEEDEIVKEISCAHCLEVEGYLLNPKILPCGHTFCETCLLDHLEKKKIVECSTCL